jgi:carbamoyltransferase
MNSVANGKIPRKTAFKDVYIQSAAGDAGGAIGAAFVAWYGESKAERSFVMDHAYWGPHYDDNEVSALLKEARAKIEESGCSIQHVAEEEEVCRRAAMDVAKGKIVGWFQGRMEWGPRALGNRSIIADPRLENIRDILNAKIKRRESFRPFAPSILRDMVSEWFEDDGDVPFMMQVFPIKESKRKLIPSVTHVDGTGRLQSVTRDSNPRYYRLIEEFHRITGVPMVLNTSFNENEPVVCRPNEALDCFLRTRMDVLVLGNYFVERVGVE